MEKALFLSELVKIDSSTPTKANECIEKCAQYLSEQGIKGEILEQNGIKSYVSIVGEGGKVLILNGHVDVVSGKNSQFEPHISGSRFYGRGAADMKGGVVAMIYAFCQLKSEKLGCKVMLQLVADEEVGGENGTKFLVDRGYTGDFVICSEPTNLNISVNAKGILRLDIITKGFAAHGSRPWEGDNAIIKSLENFDKIERLPIINQSSKYYDRTSVNLAFIKGGDIYNRVPDETLMGLDIRFVPHIDPQDIIAAIKDAVEGEVVVKNIEPSINVAEDCTYVHVLKEITTQISKFGKVELIGQHGTSDARFFSGKGIPAIEFGPVGNGWHGDGEFVDLESIAQLEKIIISFAKKF